MESCCSYGKPLLVWEHVGWRDITRICWLQNLMLLVTARIMINRYQAMVVRSTMEMQVALLKNGKNRLRRSLDAWALDFIVQIFLIRRCWCLLLCIVIKVSPWTNLLPSLMQDLPRTFPGHPALNDNGRNSLRRLLVAYARHNPSVGYCQVSGVKSTRMCCYFRLVNRWVMLQELVNNFTALTVVACGFMIVRNWKMCFGT